MKKVIYGAITLLIAVTLFFFISYENRKVKQAAPYLTVYGPIISADGLGQQALGVVHALKKRLSVICIPTRNVHEKLPREVSSFVHRHPKKNSTVFLFEEALWYPDHPEWLNKYIAKMPIEGLKIAYSMFETSRIPPEWVVILNCYFDAVAVPDKFLIDVYQNSGVLIPIFEVPLGVHLEPFLAQPLKKKKNLGLIVFGNMSSCTERKNQIGLVRAFAKAFGNREDVLLKINARGADPAMQKALTREIERLGLDNIFFTQMVLDKKKYLEFFKTLDCYVSCSKGEGFSIQPREAMALGIPVIATDNTGQSTICESGLVRSVASTVAEPAYLSCFGQTPYGTYTSCTIDALAEAMLDVQENYFDYLAKGESARAWVSQYLYSNLDKLYLSLVRPKKVVLGSENKVTEECVFTTSQELYQKYQQLSAEAK